MESYRRLRGAGSYSSEGRLLMRDGIFLWNRRELRHGKFWPIRRQMRIRLLMESFEGARVRPRAYISWQSDPLKEYTSRVGREDQRQLTEERENVVYVTWVTV